MVFRSKGISLAVPVLAGQTMHMDHIHFRIILVAINCHISANMFRTSLLFRFALQCSTSNHTPDRYLLFTQSHHLTSKYPCIHLHIYIHIHTHLHTPFRPTRRRSAPPWRPASPRRPSGIFRPSASVGPTSSPTSQSMSSPRYALRSVNPKVWSDSVRQI